MIIAVNNNKGGCLKTTVTTNLAGVMAKQGYKVLVVDADSQSNVALSFGVNPDSLRTSLADVLLDRVPAEDAIVKVHANIDILPSNADLVDMEFKVIGNPKKFPKPFQIMKPALEHLNEKYDYILIDTPPSLGLIVGNAFALADKVLIPFTPEYYSIRSLKAVVDTVNDFIEDHNENLDILGILPTLVKPDTNLHQEILQQTKKFAKNNELYVFETYITNTIQFGNANRFHKTPASLVKKKKGYDKAELFVPVFEEIKTVMGKEAVR
ncbi:ParA family protein [Peribacillus muralis]|uniref:ParA family protein n=1 Tax=Peribacillus muralis TaxID=264697 RepID=UPI00366B90AF